MHPLNQKINLITTNYRNPSGHTELIDYQSCLECRDLVLQKGGVLAEMLDNFKIIKWSVSTNI